MSPTSTSHFATSPPVVNLGGRSVKSFISRKIVELPVSRQIMQFHVFFQVTHPLLTNSVDVCSCMQFHVFQVTHPLLTNCADLCSYMQFHVFSSYPPFTKKLCWCMLLYAISCFLNFFTLILSPAYLSQLSKRFFWGEQQTLAVFFPPTGEYTSYRSRKTI